MIRNHFQPPGVDEPEEASDSVEVFLRSVREGSLTCDADALRND